MKIIYKEKGKGKTEELIELCAKNGGYIVCSNSKEATNLVERAKKMNLTIPFPLTFNEFVEGKYYAPGVKKLYIDNVELLLTFISKCNIEAITLTKEENSDEI